MECAPVEEYVIRHKLAAIGFEVNDRWMSSILIMGQPKTYDPMIMGPRSFWNEADGRYG